VKLKQQFKQLSTLLIAFLALVTATAAAPAEGVRKTAVVSFGLSGEQDVFRSEATGAASILASRFGADPVIVRFNTRKNGDATVEALPGTDVWYARPRRYHPVIGLKLFSTSQM